MTTALWIAPLLARRNFALFWASQSVSAFGDQLTVIALAALMWDLTRSSLFTGLVVIVSTVPHAFFGFLAGPVADAYGRRRTLVACDLVRMTAIALMPVLIGIGLPVATVFACVLVAACASALFAPTKAALLPELLAADSLARGNAFVQLSDRVIEIGGKAVAGVLFLLIGPLVFAIDALTFLLSALLLSRVVAAEPEIRVLDFAAVFTDMSTGLKVIRANTVLSANLVFSLFAQVSVAVVNTLLPVYLFRELGGGPDSFGVAEAVLAAGVVVAAVAVPSLIARNKKGRLVVAGFLFQGIAVLAIWLSSSIQFSIGLLFVAGAANAVYLISNVTIYQENTAPQYRGRVFSSRYALLNLVWLPIMVVSAVLAESLSAAALIGISGLVTLVVAIVGAFSRSVRDVS